jgi:hypothetical protein
LIVPIWRLDTRIKSRAALLTTSGLGPPSSGLKYMASITLSPIVAGARRASASN